MAKVVKQYRYYDDRNTSKNQPLGLKKEDLNEGSVFFTDSLKSIIQLGIQTLPGTKFYLNNGEFPIIVGSTGIYELDLEGLSEITVLNFDLRSLSNIEEVGNAFLIVDALYEVEED